MYADHSRESCESAAEWNVRASTPSTPSASRPLLPRGLVREGHREDLGRLERSATWHPIRCVVVVLPVPAPAGSRPALGARARLAGLVQAGEDALEIGHRSDPNIEEGRTRARPRASPG